MKGQCIAWKVYFCGDDLYYSTPQREGNLACPREEQKLHIIRRDSSRGQDYTPERYNTVRRLCLRAKPGKKSWKIETPLRRSGRPSSPATSRLRSARGVTTDLRRSPKRATAETKPPGCAEPDRLTGRKREITTRARFTRRSAQCGAVYFAPGISNLRTHRAPQDDLDIDLGTPCGEPTMRFAGRTLPALHCTMVAAYATIPKDGKIYGRGASRSDGPTAR